MVQPPRLQRDRVTAACNSLLDAANHRGKLVCVSDRRGDPK
jgi:hypothetical protein